MGGIRHRGHGREVVDPVEVGLVRDGVNATQEEVDVVGLPRSQAGGELPPDERSNSGRREIGLVPHRVELGVRLDVFGKLDCKFVLARRDEALVVAPRVSTGIARFSRVRHQCVLVELPGLIVSGLEDRRTPHGSLGGRDDGEVLAGNTQEYFPVIRPWISFANESWSEEKLT